MWVHNTNKMLQQQPWSIALDSPKAIHEIPDWHKLLFRGFYYCRASPQHSGVHLNISKHTAIGSTHAISLPCPLNSTGESIAIHTPFESLGLGLCQVLPQVHFEYGGPWIGDLVDFVSLLSSTFIFFCPLLFF